MRKTPPSLVNNLGYRPGAAKFILLFQASLLVSAVFQTVSGSEFSSPDQRFAHTDTTTGHKVTFTKNKRESIIGRP